ncbi:hypothetical protein KNU84_gp054 [Bacteriophage DSS3_VP1]|uniref:Uncharacterized protein n=1 Tax=Bacteriophage DSS3_VP1 TaxID=2664196 RepID=A0A7S5FY53_9CAUD|nr:hypothetical protein KNU84_gp054 [Bacteriophage DSS3_VP1]QGH74650.1 hypothetical protein DSS3VP1_00082 [Bacteriophage DSS3_VP1]
MHIVMNNCDVVMRYETKGDEGEIVARRIDVGDPEPDQELIQITESAYELWIGCVKAGETILGLADWYNENKETLE